MGGWPFAASAECREAELPLTGQTANIIKHIDGLPLTCPYHVIRVAYLHATEPHGLDRSEATNL
jgi:hypothetical protein